MTPEELEMLDARFAALMVDYGISNVSIIGFYEIEKQVKAFGFSMSNPEKPNFNASLLCSGVFQTGIEFIKTVPGASVTEKKTDAINMIVKGKNPKQ